VVKAGGGVVGAAAGGGIRNGMTLVGEAGPELVSLPVGSTVHGNPDTQRMMGAGNSSGWMEAQVSYSGSDPLMNEIVKALRIKVRKGGGGGPNSVQTYLGQTA